MHFDPVIVQLSSFRPFYLANFRQTLPSSVTEPKNENKKKNVSGVNSCIFISKNITNHAPSRSAGAYSQKFVLGK